MSLSTHARTIDLPQNRMTTTSRAKRQDNDNDDNDNDDDDDNAIVQSRAQQPIPKAYGGAAMNDVDDDNDVFAGLF